MTTDYEYTAIRPMTATGLADSKSHRPPITPAPSRGPCLKRRRSSAPPQIQQANTTSTILHTVLFSKLSYTLPCTCETIDFPVGILMAQVLLLGGADAVTTGLNWPAVLRNLASGIKNIDSEDAEGLADLYTKSVKPWEPSVFAGLLSEWVAQQTDRPWAPEPAPEPAKPRVTHDFFAPALASKVSTPLPDLAHANANPFNSLDLNLSLLSEHMESPAFVAPGGEMDDGRPIGDFESLLASMQEDQERADQAPPPVVDWFPSRPRPSKDEVQLPTPPQDKIAIRRESECSEKVSAAVTYSPVSMAQSNSPYDHSPSSSSTPDSAITIHVSKKSRSNPPKHIGLPTEPFRPPPPMCMYFHNGFYDLQKDKIGVWRGQLGVMNDSFSIMVVGEAGRGKRELWQTEKWASPITFPSDPQAASSGDLITVTDLVKQGLVPLTMGMVLCDGQRPGEIDRFVRFVASLHSTGTAFRLSSSHPLPIVFIPSKFHAEDPLQRLGIAVMGLPKPASAAPKTVPKKVEPLSSTRRRASRRSSK